MAKITNITTGEQAVSATGAVTGSLDTSAMSGDYTVKVRVSGLTAGQIALVVVEDTANVTPFSDAHQIAAFHFVGGPTLDGSAREVRSCDIPAARFGSTNTKLRLNCQSISAGTANVFGWLEQ